MNPLAVLLLAALAAQDAPAPPASAESFAVEREAIEDALRRREWRDAEKLVLQALETHAGADYVRPHLAGLREDLQRAAFWKGAKEPDPKTLVSGKLLNYEPRSGHVVIEYERGRLDDFERDEDLWLHPMKFAAPWKVSLEGTPDEVHRIALLAQTSDSKAFLGRFGKHEPEDLVYFKHLLVEATPSGQRVVELVDPVQRKSERTSVRAEFEIRLGELRMEYDGRKVLEHERARDDYGSFVMSFPDALDGIPAFGTLRISGKIDPGWIGGLADAALGEQRAAFDASWIEPEVFQAWGAVEEGQAEPELTTETLSESVLFRLPLPDELQGWFAKVQDLRGSSFLQTRKLAEELGAMEAGRIPLELLEYLRFQLALDLECYDQARTHCETLAPVVVDPALLELLRAQLTLLAGRAQEAREALGPLLETEPRHAVAYVLAAQAALLAGNAQDAHELVQRGRSRFPSSAEIRDVETRVVRAARGPQWKRVLEETGARFVVRFDGNRKRAAEALAVLEDAWKRCREFFGELPAEPRSPSVAYIFAGQTTYLAFVDGIADGSHENTLGIYSPLLKCVAAWEQPDREGLSATLRHECAHRYLDLMVGHAIPRWLNEGLAETFTAAFDAEGRFQPGRLQVEHLEAIGSLEFLLVDPVTFVRDWDRTFAENSTLAYAESWALVHWLRFTDATRKGVVERLLAGLGRGADAQSSIASAYAGIDEAQWSVEFLAWVNARLRSAR